MPELPEVETTRRGIGPLIDGRTVTAVVVRDRRLRLPVPARLPELLVGRRLATVRRRAKYLLFDFDGGTLLGHLGMSGSLRVVQPDTPPATHDHLDIVFDHAYCLRLRDPRRFGLVDWTTADPAQHRLLRALGPEPWDTAVTGGYFRALAHGRSAPVKNFIMDGKVIVGVGNIYANEALHRTGIHPVRAAGRVSLRRYNSLTVAIREVLEEAIAEGGTTLRDFVRNDGKPGYFRHRLRVYDRAGLPCACGRALVRRSVIGQRASYFCPRCQR